MKSFKRFATVFAIATVVAFCASCLPCVLLGVCVIEQAIYCASFGFALAVSAD